MTNVRRTRPVALVVFVVAVAVYWRTAYPTITWWDSGNYSIAASTLGVASPPGSLLLTLLGWPVAHLPFISSPARALNVFAGILAALASVLVYAVALRTLRLASQTDLRVDAAAATIVGAALGALAFAFSNTLWDHAIKFTPYVLTAVFTGLILRTMLRWWENADGPDAWQHLALLGFLFGLDFSVHRTNALLIPAAFMWIVIRRPQTLRMPRAWLGSAGGLVAGIAVQFLVIPMAMVSRSPWNFNTPTTLRRFWEYESISDRGGSFLLQLFPRKAAVWSVQIMDLLRVLGANFVHWTGQVGVLGALPAIAAVFGLIVLWRRERRLGMAFTLLLFAQAATTVIYFNIPANFFRTFDRHYLPVCVTIAVLVAYGLGAAIQWLANRRMAAAGAVLVVVVPSAQLVMNWTARDASKRHFTRDYAMNALEALPPNAIYFTAGDNDTWPVMYLQSVEGVRPDVRIVNLSSMYYSTFAEQTLRRDPAFPISPPIHAPKASLGDSTLRNIVSTNDSRLPVTFALSARGAMNWLAPYGRLDGIFVRVLSSPNPRMERDSVRAQLLGRYNYRGYADSSVQMDDVTRGMAFLYYNAFRDLLKADHASGNDARCRETAAKMLALLPPERVSAPAGFRREMMSECGVAQ
jgi:hypothetical protein